MLTLVLVMIVASVVALVLVNDDNSNSNRTAAGQPISSGSVPTGAATSTDSSAPASSSSVSVAEPAAKSTRPAGASVPVGSTATVPSSSMSPVANDRPSKKAPRQSLTYIVKRGDNLYVIARWFTLHGYGDLYQQNKAVIGANPDLIHPGQKITVKNGLMTATT